MAGRTEVTVGEFTFFIRKLAAFDALKLIGDLQKRIVSPAAMLIATQRKAAPATDAEFAEGLRKLSEALDGATLVWAVRSLVNDNYITVRMENGEIEKLTDNTVGVMDIGLDVLVELAIEVAKVNFFDFMKSASGRIGVDLSRKKIENQ